MPGPPSIPTQRSGGLRLLLIFAVMGAALVVVLHHRLPALLRRDQTPSSNPTGPAENPADANSITNIAIGPETLHAGVKRFGINLSGQTFYDSGQMLKNLIFRNPGFEGETWQSNLQCKSVSANTCTDANNNSAWPADFLDGAQYLVLSGAAKGTTGTVQTSTAGGSSFGVTLTFANAPQSLAANDFLQVSLIKPGDGSAGWWTNVNGGATLSTELHDLSSETPGKQALRVEAAGPGQSAGVSSYFDSTVGRSFLQLRGQFALHFRAKLLAGSPTLPVSFGREPSIYFQKNFTLTPTWQDYSATFSLKENGSAVGTIGLNFAIQQSSVLLDDVELTPIGGDPSNHTAFRDEVVDTLRTAHPGILRFMDNGTSFGSTLDDLLAPPFARRRGGALVSSKESQDIPIGLHEELTLAQAIGAEPWFTMPATTSPDEARKLIEYLAGPATSAYGAKRAALGQSAPWTSVFPVIHLEFGNEMWGSFPGSAVNEPAVYGALMNSIFTAAESSPYYRQASFDLIADGQGPNTYWTGEMLKANTAANSIDFAPYLFSPLNDVSSTEAIFGSMFAEPEQLSTTGYMAQQVKLARSASHPVTPSVYEVNLGTSSSATNLITQADIDRIVPSMGGGLATADHMLLMLRELGITNQCLFALPEFANQFSEPGDSSKTTPLWGSVVDMGGPTNLRRPTYLALEMMNAAILPQELTTHLTGANPTWSQPSSQNSEVKASQPHQLQTFAFADGPHHTLILLNLSRTLTLQTTFSGPAKPGQSVTESRLTSAHLTDNNEQQANVAIARRTLNNFVATAPYSLPPFSMTVLDWQTNWQVLH